MDGSGISYGIVEAYDEVTDTARVRPVEDPRAVWSGVPITAGVMRDLIAVGDTVLLCVWPDGRCVIVGVVGVRPVWPLTYRDSYDTWEQFTSESYVERSNMSVTAVLRVSSYLWVSCLFTWHNDSGSYRDILGYGRVFVDDAAATGRAFFGGYSGQRMGQCISDRLGPYDAGSHDVDLRVALYSASYTCKIGWTSLAVMVVPA